MRRIQCDTADKKLKILNKTKSNLKGVNIIQKIITQKLISYKTVVHTQLNNRDIKYIKKTH